MNVNPKKKSINLEYQFNLNFKNCGKTVLEEWRGVVGLGKYKRVNPLPSLIGSCGGHYSVPYYLLLPASGHIKE